MRNEGIEIRVNKDKLTATEIKYLEDSFDFEYNAQTGFDTLWIHDDGNFPFNRELFNYMKALISAYNRKTGTTHLDLFIEVSEIDEYEREITLEDGTIKYYKNLTLEDLFSINLETAILKKELN